MSWRRFGVLVGHLPAGSATVRAVGGDRHQWGEAEYLLAAIVDVLRVGNWQRGGNKRAPRPKPIPRPGQKTPGVDRRGTKSLTPDEFHAAWRPRGSE